MQVREAWNVSIHAPNEGSDLIQKATRRARVVSIHAPNEGSDLLLSPRKLQTKRFQSTLPMKGATERMQRAAIR